MIPSSAPFRLTRSLARRLFVVGAVLAAVGQSAVALVALGESRDARSAAAHVEQSGTSTHYAHNDATCVTCQARSLSGLTERPAPPRTSVARATLHIARAHEAPSIPPASRTQPRAPPALAG